MKIFIPILTLLLGFGLGWHLSGKRTQEHLKAIFPEEMHVAIKEMAEHFEPMSSDQVHDTMEMIRRVSKVVVSEFDQQTLGRVLVAERLKHILEENGKEAIATELNYEFNRFFEQYEEGLELGEWQKVADAIYERNHNNGEPDGGINSESLRSSP